jgi:hypothetical protein
VLRSTTPDSLQLVCDVHYEMDAESGIVEQTLAAFHRNSADPSFRIRPTRGDAVGALARRWDTLARRLPFRSDVVGEMVDMSDAHDFSSRFQLREHDVQAARRALTPDRLEGWAATADNPSWAADAHASWLVVYREHAVIPGPELPEFIARATALAAHLGSSSP